MKRLVVILLFLFAFTGCEDVPPEEDPITCEDGYTLINDDCLDVDAPIIEIDGDREIIMYLEDELPTWDISVDDVDEDAHLFVSGLDDIDTEQLGTYYVYVNAIDTSGNIADEVKLRVDIINRPPSLMVSFVNEYIGSASIRVTSFLPLDTLYSLTLSLYDDDELVTSMEYQNDTELYKFDSLERNKEYQIVIEGMYESGSRLGSIPFEKSPITVGTFRHIDESYRTLIPDTDVFNLLESLVYLPFDRSNDSKTEDMIKRLSHIDYDILFELQDHICAIMFVNNHVTDIEDYADWPNNDIIPYITGCPSVLLIDFHGTSIDITTQMIGNAVATYYLPIIELSSYWQDIYTAEAVTMFPTTRYKDSPFEFFIESFAYYYYSDASRAELLENAPQAHAFISSLQEIYEGNLYTDWEDTITFPD